MFENEDATSANNISVENSLAAKSDSGRLKERCYFCKICDIGFSTFPSLKDHLSALHTVKITRKSHFCQTCEEGFPSLLGFKIHLHREHTIEKVSACIKCNFQLPHERVIPTLHSGDTYLEHYCIVCQEEIKDRKRKKKEADKTQSDVKKKIPSRKDVSKVRKTRGMEKTFTCEVCLMSYASPESLNNHLLNKHGVRNKDKPHHCGICQKGFSHLGTLKMHRQREHIETKPHVCGVCNEKFAFEDQLLTHSRRRHPPKKRCDICLKEVSVSYFRVHMRTHFGIKPYACIACDKRFTTTSRLKTHCLSHTGEKPHVCDTCGRGFRVGSHLNTHMLLHTGEKPHVCDICQRGFTQKWVMVAHRRIHTGERPFECDVCQRGFIYKSQLKTHQLTHCKDRPPN